MKGWGDRRIVRNYYINTNYKYLYGCIPVILIFILALTNPIIMNKKIYCIVMLVYLCLVCKCVYDTYKEREQMNEIITKGRAMKGKVTRLLEVSYETSFIRNSVIDEKTAYRIVAECDDEFNYLKEYQSDIIFKKYKKHIPQTVGIYRYNGKICIIWEPTSESVPHIIEKKNEVVAGKKDIMLLRFINRIYMCIPIYFIIAWWVL